MVDLNNVVQVCPISILIYKINLRYVTKYYSSNKLENFNLYMIQNFLYEWKMYLRNDYL